MFKLIFAIEAKFVFRCPHDGKTAHVFALML